MPRMSEGSRRLVRVGLRDVLLIDSITELRSNDAGRIVVSGSHGGSSSGGYAAAVPASLFAFNDAGGGKDGAGYAALALLGQNGIPAVTVCARSARIGDARDTLESGLISHANDAAEAHRSRAEAVRRGRADIESGRTEHRPDVGAKVAAALIGRALREVIEAWGAGE